MINTGDDSFGYGWKYKNDTTQVSATSYNASDYITCEGCLDYNILGYYSTNNVAETYTSIRAEGHDFPLMTYKNPIIISGVDTDTLSIENIPFSMDGYLFQLEMVNEAYGCALPVSTQSSTLNVFLPDFDNDVESLFVVVFCTIH